MEKYQIIPRKFRPKRFAEVAGHRSIVETLKNALKQERVGQAYLFCGARGCGKTTLARLFAKALNCAHIGEEFEPCNSCESCQEIAKGSNLDVIEIDGASNRGIDDIRQINETVGYAPHHGHYKIYIIDEVHMLTKEAFNALLKTLEEPPKNVKFFFATTEPHKVPPTIISRCQRFNLGRIPEKELVEKLTRITKELQVDIEEAALIQVSRLSEGSLRDAESLLDQLICFGKTPITLDLAREAFGLIATDSLSELDSAIQSKNLEQASAIAKSLYQSGKDVGAVVDALLDHFHEHLEKQTTYTKHQALALLDTLIHWQQQMLKIPLKPIHLEMLLLTLVRNAHQISLDHLIERLLELEGKLTPLPSPPKMEEKPIQKQQPDPEPSPQPKPMPPPTEAKAAAHPSKYDTLVRFAAIELEGSVERS